MAGFKMQGQIVMLMLQAVDSDQIIDQSQRIVDILGNEHGYSSNKEFAMFLIKDFICEMFTNLNSVQVEGFIIRLFNTVSDWSGFKVTLRDLLVSMKKFSSSDDEFYREEKEVSVCVSDSFRPS
jgi:CRM1 C terminal